MVELTEKQNNILQFIHKKIKEGLPPTQQEIAANFNITKGAARNHLEALIKKGYVRTEYKKSRSIFIN